MALPYYVPSVQLPFNVGPYVARNQALEQSISDRVRAAMALASAEKVAELNNATEMAKAKMMADTERSRQAASERVAALDPASRERIAKMQTDVERERYTSLKGNVDQNVKAMAGRLGTIRAASASANADLAKARADYANTINKYASAGILTRDTKGGWQVNRAMPPSTIAAAEGAIKQAEDAITAAQTKIGQSEIDLNDLMRQAAQMRVVVDPVSGDAWSADVPNSRFNAATAGTQPSGVSGGLPSAAGGLPSAGGGLPSAAVGPPSDIGFLPSQLSGPITKQGFATARNSGGTSVLPTSPVGAPSAYSDIGLIPWSAGQIAGQGNAALSGAGALASSAIPGLIHFLFGGQRPTETMRDKLLRAAIPLASVEAQTAPPQMSLQPYLAPTPTIVPRPTPQLPYDPWGGSGADYETLQRMFPNQLPVPPDPWGGSGATLEEMQRMGIGLPNFIPMTEYGINPPEQPFRY